MLHNELIEKLASRNKDDLLVVLDGVKDYIADARNGDYSTEARLLAIEAINTVLYNKIKGVGKTPSKEKPEDWL